MNFSRVRALFSRRAAAPRERGGIGAVIFLIVALVFAPVIGLHIAGLAQTEAAAGRPLRPPTAEPRAIDGVGTAMDRLAVGGEIGAEQEPAAGPAWIDLLNPTPEQDRELLARLGVDIPTREEMEEIESSSRTYEEGGVAYMTALVVCRTDTDEPGNTPVSFVLTPTHLVTVRFADLSPFRAFAARCRRQPRNAEASATAFAGLMELIVDRTADVLERADADLAAISAEVFRGRSGSRPAPAGAARSRRPRRACRPPHDLLSKVRESLLTLQRVLAFARQAAGAAMPAEAKARLKTAERDVRSLVEHDGHLNQKAVVPPGRDARADQQPAEPYHQDLLGGGGGVHAADAGRQHLRHELRPHARAGAALGLSGLPGADDGLRDHALPLLQAPGLALTPAPTAALSAAEFEELATRRRAVRRRARLPLRPLRAGPGRDAPALPRAAPAPRRHGLRPGDDGARRHHALRRRPVADRPGRARGHDRPQHPLPRQAQAGRPDRPRPHPAARPGAGGRRGDDRRRRRRARRWPTRRAPTPSRAPAPVVDSAGRTA